jgi:hypothetical protein
MKFRKRLAGVYDFTKLGDGAYSWALFFVDEQSNTLSIVSDWGNWSYMWGPTAWSFKEFLVQMSTRVQDGYPGYLLEKLTHGQKEELDYDATFKAMEAVMQKARDALPGDPETTQTEKFAMDELERADTVNELWIQMYQGDYRAVFDKYWPELPDVPVKMKKHGEAALRALFKEALPPFLDALKSEFHPDHNPPETPPCPA